MRPARHGLVIGKFYPPHAGHHLLISTAAAASERVTVLVLSHEVESIPHADRVAWLREVHAGEPHVTVHGVIDDHPVDFSDPTIWDLHEAVFRAGVAAVTEEPVTAVFSSEDYGEELARRLGATSVPVDVDRGLAPVSGTAVRADPVAHWAHLRAPVRAWFVRRAVVHDAEVADAVASALRDRGGAHAATARVRHADEEDRLARRGGPVLVCDPGAISGPPAVVVETGDGGRVAEVASALEAIDAVLAEGWDLAPPRLPPSPRADR